MMNRRGFNFIEIFLAVTIMACCSIPLFFIMTMGSRGVVVSTREVAAINHCSALMEILKGASYEKLLSMTGRNMLILGQLGWWQYNPQTGRYEDISTGGDYSDDPAGAANPENLRRMQWTTIGGGQDSQLSGWLLSRHSTASLNGDGGSMDLPPLEAYFTRRLQIDCTQEDYCFIAVQVDWPHESPQAAAQGKRRSVDLRTLVVQP